MIKVNDAKVRGASAYVLETIARQRHNTAINLFKRHGYNNREGGGTNPIAVYPFDLSVNQT